MREILLLIGNKSYFSSYGSILNNAPVKNDYNYLYYSIDSIIMPKRNILTSNKAIIKFLKVLKVFSVLLKKRDANGETHSCKNLYSMKFTIK